MRLLAAYCHSCFVLQLCCGRRSLSRSMALSTCLRGRVLTRASSLTIGSAARPSSDGQALLTRHSSSSRTCSCSLAELQASAPLHLRGASEVANTRVAFCRSFRITIQIGTCACHAVVCAALDRTAWPYEFGQRQPPEQRRWCRAMMMAAQQACGVWCV